MQALLARGAEANAAGRGGLTALMTASFRGDIDVVEALLAKGADVNAEMADGRTALDAAKEGGRPAVRALLRKAGAKD